MTKYNIALFLITFQRFEEALHYFSETEKLNTENVSLKFCKAFCIDLISKEDDIQGYLDLIANFPHIQHNYFNCILLYLKSGNHEAAEKIIDLYISIFNDFDAKGLLVIWTTFNYINFYQNDRMHLYQKRLECFRNNKYVYDFYILNKSILNINYNKSTEEAEFLLENLYNETLNKNIKLIAGINLVMLMENQGLTRFRAIFLRRIISDFKNHIDCYDFEKKYEKLRTQMLETDREYLFELERSPIDETMDESIQAYRQLLFYPMTNKSSNSIATITSEVKKKDSGKSLSKIYPEFQKALTLEKMDKDEIENIVNDFYFRVVFEAIEEVMDPTFIEKGVKSLYISSNGSSGHGSMNENNNPLQTSLSNIDVDELFQKSIKHLQNNDLLRFKEMLVLIHKVNPKFREALITFSLGQLISTDLLRRRQFQLCSLLFTSELRSRN